MKTKILIVKLGYSETLDQEIGKTPSLGDILRTTPILWALKEKYKDAHITWLVSDTGYQLLADNKLIDRILIWDEFVGFQLMREKFDILINLEKIAGICALVDMIDAWTKFGFRFDSYKGAYSAYEKGENFIEYLASKSKKKGYTDYWQKILIEMLGCRWQGQEYILGYQPKSELSFDIGLNYQVGAKWPSKKMADTKWQELNNLLIKNNYKVSWQKGLNNIYEYIDWINSCKIIITHDSLGLHIALALKKKIIAIFASTDPNEIYSYNLINIVKPEITCPLMACYSAKCLNGLNCIDSIDINKIVELVRKISD